MAKLERIEEVLESMDGVDIVEVWNAYCDDANRSDDRIYCMNWIEDDVSSMSAMDIVRTFCGCEFDPDDEWYWYDGSGNPASSNDPFDAVSVYELAQYIESHEEDYHIPEIAEILESSDGGEES